MLGRRLFGVLFATYFAVGGGAWLLAFYRDMLPTGYAVWCGSGLIVFAWWVASSITKAFTRFIDNNWEGARERE